MIKGILFDKDGTIIDFFSLWLSAAKKVIPEFMKVNHLDSEHDLESLLMETIGICDDQVDPKGALAYKSYREIAEDIVVVLRKQEIILETETVKEQLEQLFQKSVEENEMKNHQLADMKALVHDLKERKVYVGLATADTMKSAKHCLKSLDVYQDFDYIGADDGVKKPKPDGDMFLEFQEKCGLKADEIAVVGDTQNDVLFAKNNGGIAIGLLSGVSRKEDYSKHVDYILNSVVELPEFLDQMMITNR